MAYYNWMSNSYGEFPEEEPSTAEPTAAQLKAQADAAAMQGLVDQILGSSDSSKWQGAGFGSAQANANDMAKILSGIGITDINQFGKWTTPDYKTINVVQRPTSDDGGATEFGYYSDEGGDSPVWKTISPEIAAARDENGLAQIQTGEKDIYGNKLTKQAVGNTYGERQVGNAWGGTYAGEGNTGYRVRFDAQGNPHFYTTGASSSDIGDIAPLLMMASFIPGLQPFAMAANAAIAASQGNPLGALASLAGIPGVSDVLGSGVTSALTTANQAKNLYEAVDSGNLLGVIGAGANLTGTGGTQIGDTGFNVSDALKAANVAKAFEAGDMAPLINALGSQAMKNGFTNAPNSADFDVNSMDSSGISDIENAGFLGTGSEIAAQYQNTPTVQPTEMATVPTEQQSQIDAEAFLKTLAPYAVPSTTEDDVPEMVMTAERPEAETEPGFDNWQFLAPAPEDDVPEMVMTAERPEAETEPGFDNWQLPVDDSEPGFDNWQPTPPAPSTPAAPTSPAPTSPAPTSPAKPATPAKPAASSSGNLGALLALLAADQGQNQQQAVQPNVADIKSFEQLGYGSLFGPELFAPAPASSAQKTNQYSDGGQVEDLLRLLRS